MAGPLWGSSPRRFFQIRQTGPAAHTASCTTGNLNANPWCAYISRERRRYSSNPFSERHWKQVVGQHHAPSALLPWKPGTCSRAGCEGKMALKAILHDMENFTPTGIWSSGLTSLQSVAILTVPSWPVQYVPGFNPPNLRICMESYI